MATIHLFVILLRQLIASNVILSNKYKATATPILTHALLTAYGFNAVIGKTYTPSFRRWAMPCLPTTTASERGGLWVNLAATRTRSAAAASTSAGLKYR